MDLGREMRIVLEFLSVGECAACNLVSTDWHALAMREISIRMESNRSSLCRYAWISDEAYQDLYVPLCDPDGKLMYRDDGKLIYGDVLLRQLYLMSKQCWQFDTLVKGGSWGFDGLDMNQSILMFDLTADFRQNACGYSNRIMTGGNKYSVRARVETGLGGLAAIEGFPGSQIFDGTAEGLQIGIMRPIPYHLKDEVEEGYKIEFPLMHETMNRTFPNKWLRDDSINTVSWSVNTNTISTVSGDGQLYGSTGEANITIDDMSDSQRRWTFDLDFSDANNGKLYMVKYDDNNTIARKVQLCDNLRGEYAWFAQIPNTVRSVGIGLE